MAGAGLVLARAGVGAGAAVVDALLGGMGWVDTDWGWHGPGRHGLGLAWGWAEPTPAQPTPSLAHASSAHVSSTMSTQHTPADWNTT